MCHNPHPHVFGGMAVLNTLSTSSSSQLGASADMGWQFDRASWLKLRVTIEDDNALGTLLYITKS